LNYETSGRDLGFAFPSLGGFACIEGMVIRCVAHLSLGIRSAQASNGYSQDFSRLRLFFLGSPACDFRPYPLSQGRRHYIESIGFLPFIYANMLL